jgi:hypothetical protein
MTDGCDDELLIVEHVISMAATSNAAIEPKLLSVQEKFGTINMVDATENFPLKHSFKNFKFLCKLKM